MESSESRLTVVMFCNENVNFFPKEITKRRSQYLRLIIKMANAELNLKELQLFAACTKINGTN